MSLCFVNDIAQHSKYGNICILYELNIHTHAYKAIYKNDFINFTYFIISIVSPICGHAGCLRPQSFMILTVVVYSQSVYAILTFSVFTFPNGFIIYNFILKKNNEMGFLLNNQLRWDHFCQSHFFTPIKFVQYQIITQALLTGSSRLNILNSKS